MSVLVCLGAMLLLVSCLREDEDFEALMRRADEALYRAKAGGRDQVQLD